MRNFRLFLFLGLCLFYSGTCLLYAEPQIYEKTVPYSISGNKTKELQKALSKEGRKATGGPYHAYTKWTVNWNYKFHQVGARCYLRDIRVDARITYTMPQWEKKSIPSVDLVKEWDLYYYYLEAHERGHGDFAREAAADIEDALKEIKYAMTCPMLEEKVNEVANEILNDYRAKEKAYDKETKHGVKDGASFPVKKKFKKTSLFKDSHKKSSVFENKSVFDY